MKNHIFLLFLILISCNSESLESDTTELLLKMKALGDSQQKMVVFDLNNLDKGNYLEYIEIKDYSKKVATFTYPKRNTEEDNYIVTCNWGNGESETTHCGDDVACAGAATWDCLDSGGCATVCNSRIIYIPSSIK